MVVEGKNINLRIADTSDAEFILQLRLDEKKSRYISSVDNDLEKQINWLKEYKKRENDKKEYYFIIENKSGEKFGVLRLYDFKDDSFCWGSWIIKDDSPSYMAIESALMVYEFAFYTLGFKNTHFDVRKKNEKVISFHKRLGAQVVDEDELNYYFIYPKTAYEEIREKYKKYLPN